MTQYFLYLIEASICLSLFYIIYLLFIKDETFHKLKRFYLLASVIISIAIPILPSAQWTKKIEKTIIPQKVENVSDAISHNNFGRILFGSTQDQTVIHNKERQSITFFEIFGIFYVLGIVLMSFRLALNFYQIYSLIKRNENKPNRKYTIIPLADDYPTFSFFRYIFINDKNLNENDKNDILFHEEIHIKQGHSYDIVFIEIYKILFWFNPLLSLYKNSLLKVHECLADEFVLRSRSINLQDYQSLLLKQYLSNFKIELAHPFNYSLIKFRIAMMTKTKSKRWAKYKLLFAIPIIIISLVAFTNDRLNLPAGEKSLQTQLNQVELFKQLIGTWTYEMAKDTTYTLEYKFYGDSLTTYLKHETKGKIIMEQKGLFGYNKKIDKMTGVMIDHDNRTLAMWFVTKNVCFIGPILDISNPTKASPWRKCEFKTSDLLTISLLVDDKYVNEFTLTREKK